MRIANWITTVRREWTKNDDKPQEEWASGVDLKGSVLTVLAIVFLAAQIALGVWAWLR